MKKLLHSFLSVAIIVIVQISSYPQEQGKIDSSNTVKDSGADVQAFTTNGRQLKGELLSVRENSLMIFNPSNCDVLRNRWECVDQVRKDEIKKLIIEGNSYAWVGFGAGLVAGLLSFAFTLESRTGGFTNLPKYKYSEGVTVGAFLGCVLVGSAIGLLTSTQDEVIEPFSEYDIRGLSDYAKYPYGEPRDLKKIK